MTDEELEQAGRELLILETMAKISSLRQEVEGYEQRYGSYEAFQARVSRTGEKDFDLDDACNAWRWAREHLAAQGEHLKTLRSDAAWRPRPMKKLKTAKPARKPEPADTAETEARFAAEMACGESVFRYALGDAEASIEAAYQALEHLPTYAPAILTVGADEYLHGDRKKGLARLLSLVDLPDSEPDLAEVIDDGSDVLIGAKAYKDGLTLYRAAAARFQNSSHSQQLR